jgi:hypothetical protein
MNAKILRIWLVLTMGAAVSMLTRCRPAVSLPPCVVWDAHGRPPENGYAYWVRPVLNLESPLGVGLEAKGDTVRWDSYTGALPGPPPPEGLWWAIESPDPLDSSRWRQKIVPAHADSCKFDMQGAYRISLRLGRQGLLNPGNSAYVVLSSEPGQLPLEGTVEHRLDDDHGSHHLTGNLLIHSFPCRLSLSRESTAHPEGHILAQASWTYDAARMGMRCNWSDTGATPH